LENRAFQVITAAFSGEASSLLLATPEQVLTDRKAESRQQEAEASATMAMVHTGLAVARGPAVDPVAGGACQPRTTSLQASAGEAAEAILAHTIIPITAKYAADTAADKKNQKPNPHLVPFFLKLVEALDKVKSETKENQRIQKWEPVLLCS
jgi:hypothetical protein